MISGRLGEVIKESRTLATHLNGSNPTETAVMEYRSDYLGRMQWIAYPDGEKITYGYDKGGQVISVTGSNYGNEFNYVTNILYDQYGQRTRIDYGNGTFTEYNYDPARRWLDTINTQNKWGQAYQNISYSFDAVGNVLGYENDCLDSVTGNYMTKQTYSYDNLYQLIKADGETTYNPYQSSVPEFVSTYSQSFSFDADGLGNMTSKVSSETVSPQKSIGDNLNYSFNYVYNENYAHRVVRAGDRYYKYDSNGNITAEQDGSFESNGDDVSYHKITKETDNVYSTDYGWGLFREENGSGGGVKGSRYCRTYAWNERNQLISSVDSNYNTAYIYGQDGQRSNKYTQNSETLYFNKMWTLHTDSGNNVYGGQSAKNIYLGETRIVTKLNSGTNPTYQEEYYKQYYYHSDHLGSATLISDYKGDEYQRIEYTPYGETWVEKTQNTGLEYLPYKFTGKEIDEETGLYYYGARYLDPKYSHWMSTDPALEKFIEEKSNGSSGGIYNSVNFNLYHYSGNNPVKYSDSDGNDFKDTTRKFTHFVSDNSGLVEKSQKGIWPTEREGFKWDPSERVYHTTFDCWQRIGGYRDFYDTVFDLATSMEAPKFEFSSGGVDYCLWGWKGDYLNLGAGCEIGLYRKAPGLLGDSGHYLADPNLAMEVFGTLTVNGQRAGTYNSANLGKHWWPAIFNPALQGKSKDSIHAQYSLTMPNETLYNDFKKSWGDDEHFSNWNDEKHSFTVDY